MSDAVNHVVVELCKIHPLPSVQLVGRQADPGLVGAQLAAVQHKRILSPSRSFGAQSMLISLWGARSIPSSSFSSRRHAAARRLATLCPPAWDVPGVLVLRRTSKDAALIVEEQGAGCDARVAKDAVGSVTCPSVGRPLGGRAARTGADPPPRDQLTARAQLAAQHPRSAQRSAGAARRAPPPGLTNHAQGVVAAVAARVGAGGLDGVPHPGVRWVAPRRRCAGRGRRRPGRRRVPSPRSCGGSRRSSGRRRSTWSSRPGRAGPRSLRLPDLRGTDRGHHLHVPGTRRSAPVRAGTTGLDLGGECAQACPASRRPWCGNLVRAASARVRTRRVRRGDAAGRRDLRLGPFGDPKT